MTSKFAIAQIRTCHDLLRDMRTASGVKQMQLFRILMPYCLLQNGTKLIALNRKYEPLGTNIGVYWKHYDKCTLDALSIDPAQIEMPRRGCTEAEDGWFYNDATSPYRGAKHLTNYKIAFSASFSHLLHNGEV